MAYTTCPTFKIPPPYIYIVPGGALNSTHSPTHKLMTSEYLTASHVAYSMT